MDEEQFEYSSSKKGQFRFKSKHSTTERGEERAETDGHHRRRRHHRHHHHHRNHRHRHHRKRKRSPDAERENTTHPQPPPLSPDAAFRESLFDALADDEGAAYWEGIYGQPIHTYERPGGKVDEEGELERMTDEEYATYVRTRMWEKTHQGILEEQERRRKAREKMQEDRRRTRKAESEREAFQRMVDESLRRGQERQAKKRKVNEWRDAWKRYLESWEELNRLARGGDTASGLPAHADDAAAGAHTSRLRNLIVWPVESGKRRDVTPQAVREFMCNAPATDVAERVREHSKERQQASTPSTSDILDTLKIERVRWHPDKIQHRYSVLGIEEQLVKSVTEVFQILDRMWVEERAKLDKQ